MTIPQVREVNAILSPVDGIESCNHDRDLDDTSNRAKLSRDRGSDSRPSAIELAGVAARGLAMGAADVVPGVSGGTVALVTGIYPRLIATISAGSLAGGRLAKADVRGGLAALKRVDWWFLSALLLGVAVAVLTLARVIEDLLQSKPLPMAGLFLGMIVGTIIVAWRLLEQPTTRHALTAVMVGVGSFVLFGFQTAAASDPALVVYFFAGILAICAFILPGVSGSFLLLSIGMYQAVFGAVNDRETTIIAVFGLGAVLGLGFFSRLLERLLDRHFETVVALLIGLMLGSFRILWPWPNGLGDADGVGATVLSAPSGEIAAPVLLAVAGAVGVVAFSTWAERRSAG